MSIKQEMLYGVMWSAIEKYSGVIISLVISAMLARLISPQEFGVIAVATVLISFLDIFTDMGIGAAIVQRKDITSNNLNSIFTFTIIIGLFLSILFFFLAYPIASFYNNNALIVICQILSIRLFFISLNIVPQACILKKKQFKLIARRTLMLQIVSGTVSVYAAYKGAGMYSLLISPIFTAIGMFFYNIKYSPKSIDFKLDYTPFKKIFSFSVYQFLFSFMNYFSRNVDSLIIGRFFALKELGYYDKSYRLMMLPLQNVTNVITPVMLPILSSLQDNKVELSHKYNQIIKLVGTLSFPLSVFLFFTSGELIRVVYGNNWDEAVPVFRILSLSLSLQMILSTSGAIYQSANATKFLFFNGIFNTISTVSAFIFAAFLFKNIASMAWAWDISLAINTVVSFLILYRVVLMAPISLMLRQLVIPIIGSVVVGLSLYGLQLTMIIPDIFSLMVKFSVALSIYCIVIQSTKHYNLIRFLKKNK